MQNAEPNITNLIQQITHLLARSNGNVNVVQTEPMDFRDDDTLYTWMTRQTRYFDFDTARFIEMIWSIRAQYRLATKTRSIQFSSNVMVDREALMKELEVLFPTNLQTNNSFRGYFSEAELNRAMPDTVKNHDLGTTITGKLVGAYIMVGWERNVPAVILTGNPVFVDRLCNKWEALYREPMSTTVKTLLGFTAQGPMIKEDSLVESKTEIIGKDEFYPYLYVPDPVEPQPFNFDAFIKAFMESSANLLFIYGKPGTGKTSFVRRLMLGVNSPNTLSASGEVTSHPMFLPWLYNYTQECFAIVEDAHSLVLDRDIGNEQMSGLLAFLDGIVSARNKMVISSNITSLSKVDKALTRDGRCFAILEFKDLVGEEIQVARHAIGLPDIDFERYGLDPAKGMSLSTALNFRPRPKNAPDESRRIGFTG